MRQLFGTDGIRGVANREPMTPEMAVLLGRASAYVLAKKRGVKRPKVIIGKDTRLSGYLLEFALTSGMLSVGADVWLCGPLPTAAIAYLVRANNFDMGAVISASHNSYEDNGIKFFDKDGFKLPDELETEIESLMNSSELNKFRPWGSDVGRAYRFTDGLKRYVAFVNKIFSKGKKLKGLKIVVDCANGAAYRAAPMILESLGAKLELIASTPDGININDACGSLSTDSLRKRVLKTKADAGIALDGDADRAIMCDEKGNIIDGDHIMAICAKKMIDKKALAKNTLVATVMSNMGLKESIERMGGKVVRCPVGDRYVVETMKKEKYNLGGEQSGHIVFLDKSTTGDGIITACEVLSAMASENKPLSKLARVMETYPQLLVNVRVCEKRPFEKLPEIKRAIEVAEISLGEFGRIFVRYSGTENLARVMVEGKEELKIKEIANNIANLFEKHVGVGGSHD